MGNLTACVGCPSVGEYAALLRRLCDRLVEIQRPIRILDAIQWDTEVERAFFAAGARSSPPVTRDYYLNRSLPFDPGQKDHEFRLLERDVRRQLGELDPVGRLLTHRCAEYREVVRMLAQRGTHTFVDISQRLYGSTSDRLQPGGPTLACLTDLLHALAEQARSAFDTEDERSQLFDAPSARSWLADRLAACFAEKAAFRIRLADGIVADAAAGSDYVKLRRDARFSTRDLRVLEVHEGWVHLGTTLNGLAQPVCTFLAKGPPSSTVTQEGLAVLTELLSGAAHPARLRRLAGRVAALARAEAGGDFLDIYRFFLDIGNLPRDAYHQAARIFRGSLPANCGPFTKDLSYGRGLLLAHHFLCRILDQGATDRIALLFCGKTAVDDVPVLETLLAEGLLAAPTYLPPPFVDLNTLRTRLGHCGLHRLDAAMARQGEADT